MLIKKNYLTKKKRRLINSLIHSTWLLFFRLSSVVLHFVLFFQLCGYYIVGTKVFIVKSHLSPPFPLFSNTERLLKSFHALPEDYVSHLYAPKMNPTQPLYLFSLLSFIHSACGLDICYIPFLCYSNTSKSMVHFYAEDFLFSITRKISYSNCFSPKYLGITSVSSKWTMLLYCFPLNILFKFGIPINSVQSTIYGSKSLLVCWVFFLFKILRYIYKNIFVPSSTKFKLEKVMQE